MQISKLIIKLLQAIIPLAMITIVKSEVGSKKTLTKGTKTKQRSKWLEMLNHMKRMEETIKSMIDDDESEMNVEDDDDAAKIAPSKEEQSAKDALNVVNAIIQNKLAQHEDTYNSSTDSKDKAIVIDNGLQAENSNDYNVIKSTKSHLGEENKKEEHNNDIVAEVKNTSSVIIIAPDTATDHLKEKEKKETNITGSKVMDLSIVDSMDSKQNLHMATKDDAFKSFEDSGATLNSSIIGVNKGIDSSIPQNMVHEDSSRIKEPAEISKLLQSIIGSSMLNNDKLNTTINQTNVKENNNRDNGIGSGMFEGKNNYFKENNDFSNKKNGAIVVVRRPVQTLTPMNFQNVIHHDSFAYPSKSASPYYAFSKNLGTLPSMNGPKIDTAGPTFGNSNFFGLSSNKLPSYTGSLNNSTNITPYKFHPTPRVTFMPSLFMNRLTNNYHPYALRPYRNFSFENNENGSLQSFPGVDHYNSSEKQMKDNLDSMTKAEYEDESTSEDKTYLDDSSFIEEADKSSRMLETLLNIPMLHDLARYNMPSFKDDGEKDQIKLENMGSSDSMQSKVPNRKIHFKIQFTTFSPILNGKKDEIASENQNSQNIDDKTLLKDSKVKINKKYQKNSKKNMLKVKKKMKLSHRKHSDKKKLQKSNELKKQGTMSKPQNDLNSKLNEALKDEMNVINSMSVSNGEECPNDKIKVDIQKNESMIDNFKDLMSYLEPNVNNTNAQKNDNSSKTEAKESNSSGFLDGNLMEGFDSGKKNHRFSPDSITSDITISNNLSQSTNPLNSEKIKKIDENKDREEKVSNMKVTSILNASSEKDEQDEEEKTIDRKKDALFWKDNEKEKGMDQTEVKPFGASSGTDSKRTNESIFENSDLSKMVKKIDMSINQIADPSSNTGLQSSSSNNGNVEAMPLVALVASNKKPLDLINDLHPSQIATKAIIAENKRGFENMKEEGSKNSDKSTVAARYERNKTFNSTGKVKALKSRSQKIPTTTNQRFFKKGVEKSLSGQDDSDKLHSNFTIKSKPEGVSDRNTAKKPIFDSTSVLVVSQNPADNIQSSGEDEKKEGGVLDELISFPQIMSSSQNMLNKEGGSTMGDKAKSSESTLPIPHETKNIKELEVKTDKKTSVLDKILKESSNGNKVTNMPPHIPKENNKAILDKDSDKNNTFEEDGTDESADVLDTIADSLQFNSSEKVVKNMTPAPMTMIPASSLFGSDDKKDEEDVLKEFGKTSSIF